MSANKLQRLRRQAFEAQRRRCFYCGFAMWEANPQAFSVEHRITIKQSRLRRCTAEHLVAQKDQGRHTRENVVAACFWCNQRRHKGRRQQAPDPDVYKARVAMQVAKGKWHP